MIMQFIFTLILCAGLISVHADGWSSVNSERFKKFSFDKAIWYEDFSNAELPYTVEYFDGAQGKAEIVPGDRVGSQMLRVIKSNNDGYILIRFKNSISVKKGDRLQFNAFYRGIKSSPQYSLAMLRLQTPGQEDFTRYSFYPGTPGGDRLQEVINMPKQTWERKFTQREAEEAMENFEPVLIIAGAFSESIWDCFYVEDDKISEENWANNLNRRPPLDRSNEMISIEELEKKLASDIDHSAKVLCIDGKSRLLIDGEVTAPIINGPYGKFVVGKTYSNAKAFSEVGIHLVKVSIRLGQGKGSHPGSWTAKDELNVEGAVDMVRRTLQLDPNARIILSIMLHPYWQFTEDFPEETWITEKGQPAYGSGIHLLESQNGKPLYKTHFIWPSYQSAILLDLYKKQIEKIIIELKNTNLFKAVVGVHIGGGHDNQMTITHFDYSKPALQAFRKYLRDEYETVEKLRTAWRDNEVSFDSAEAPLFDSNKDHFDPFNERNYIDFYRFSKFSPWRVAGEIADFVKKLSGKDIFSMRWCQGPYDGSMAATLDFDDFFRFQKFDILVAQAAYNRRPPSSACMPRIPIDSFHQHGKLYINEFDIRTWNAAPSWEKEIMSIGWGLLLDIAMWNASHRKLAGTMFAKDMGHWYLDMAPGWFDHPGIMEDIKDTTIMGNELSKQRVPSWKADTAFVVDGDGMFLCNVPSPKWKFDVSSLIAYQVNLLGLSSVPYAFHTLNDLLENPELAQSFKVIVFAAMFHIDEKRQEFLDLLKNNNRTLVFLSGSGRLGGDIDGSGIQIKATPQKIVNHFVKAEAAVQDNMLSYWMIRRSVSLNREAQWYDPLTIVYALPKEGDRILARFAVNNEAAVVERQNENWKAVYIGEAGGLTPEYFNRIVKEAGAYYLTDSGFQCDTNGNFMSIHAMRSGEVDFRLPFKADLENLFNGRRYQSVSSIPMNVEAGTTYWFKLVPSK